jgi:hypothetical protein
MHTNGCGRLGKGRHPDRIGQGKGVSVKLSNCEQRIPSVSITKAN